MKNKILLLIILFSVILFCSHSFAQIVGTKSIPGDYPTIAAAIDSLNLQGVGGGGAIFNVSPGHTETAVNLVLTTNTSSVSDPVIFQKAGSGVNPKITAGVGSSTTTDGFIKFEGTDYVTFDGIDLEESASNEDPTTQMEWGYAILMADITNASQYITIRNCTITLYKTNTNTVGIYMKNHSANSTTTITPSRDEGRTSYCKFYGNSVSNAYIPISLVGSSNTNWYSIENEVGIVGQGENIITNFGAEGSGSIYAVYCQYQRNVKVKNNRINGGGGNTAGLYGILVTSSAGDYEISYNNVTVTSGGTSNLMYAIRGLSSGETVNIHNNIIENCTYPGATTAAVRGIAVDPSGTITTANIYSNIIRNNSQAGTGAYTLIETNANLTSLSIHSNSIYGNQKIGASGTFYGIKVAAPKVDCFNNDIYNNSFSGSSGTSASSLYGYYASGTVAEENVYNNNIYNLEVKGTNTSTSTLVYGIYTSTTASAIKKIYGNSIYELSSIIGKVLGIYQYYGNPAEVYKNNIYNLSTDANNNSNYAAGIEAQPGTNIYLYNNFISDLKAPNSTNTNGAIGINYTASADGHSLKAYYNTIYLDATSTGTNFGSSGISSAGSGSATAANLDLRNNIVVNKSVPKGTGYTVVLRRTNANLGNYSENSNNNCFYAGSPSATNLIYYDGTNSDLTISDFKLRVAPRDAASFSENPPFKNVATPPYNLHLNTTTQTLCESGGAEVTSPITVTTDYDGDLRYGATGYSGSGTAPDVGADELEGTPAVPMSFVSSSTTQNSTLVPRNTVNNHIIGIQIVTTGASNALSVNGFTLNTNGSTDAINDISNVKIFYTGNSSNFAPLGQFGATYPNPPASPTTFNITGDQTLTTGINYFWLTYDIPNTATPGNVVDAEVLSIVIRDTARTPVPTAPAGNRAILGPLSGQYSVGSAHGYPFNTITNAAGAISAVGASGATTFLLTDAVYDNSTETIPVTFNEFPGASTVNTLTIKPAPANNVTITGSSSLSIIKFNGADYVILDGSNSGGSSRNMTIVNEYSSPNAAVVWVSSLGTNAGAKYNTIKNCNIIGGSNSVAIFGIYVAGITVLTNGTGDDNDNLSVINNSIKKVRYGMWVKATATGVNDSVLISGNSIGSHIESEYVTLSGLEITQANAARIAQNEFFNIIENTSSVVTAIDVYTGVTNTMIDKNKIYSIKNTTTGSSAGAQGIYLNTGTSSNILLSNNVIYNILGRSGATLTNNSWGIILAGGSGYKIYYNSINIFGAHTSTTSSDKSGCIYIVSSVTDLNIRNNAFVNTSTPGNASNGKTYAIYSAAANTAFTSINYNDYYVSGAGTILGYLGADQATLGAWQSATSQDVNSISSDPLFTSNTNLRPQLGSPLLLAGVTIPEVTDDFLGTLRKPTPTIGAYEEAGDFVPPAITYTPLSNTSSTSNRSLPSVSITDAAGVNTNPGLRPRIYFKKSTDANVFGGNTSSNNGWKWTETGSASSPFDFTIDYSILYNSGGGPGFVTLGDFVQYFVVAQDLAPAGNVGANPSAGFTAISVGNISSAPTQPNQYKITSPALVGDYTVGLSLFNKITGKNIYPEKFTRKVTKDITVEEVEIVDVNTSDNQVDVSTNVEVANDVRVEERIITRIKQIEVEEEYSLLMENGKLYDGTQFIQLESTEGIEGVYSTITAAVADLNERGVSGPVRFLLVDADYPGETLPIVINQFGGASAVNTVTIKPQTDVTTLITGTTASIFHLNGADYVVFDGSNAVGGSTKNLTIRNTSTSGAVIRFENDATYNTVKNCIIESGNTSSTSGAITLLNGTIGGNNYNVISDNQIRDRSDVSATAPVNCIYSSGSVTAPNSENAISGNEIFNFSAAGVRVTSTGNGGKWTISNNHFYYNRTPAPSTAQTSINFTPAGDAGNNMISGNYIGGNAPSAGGSAWLNSGAVAFVGIAVVVDSNSASSVANNVVRNISLSSTGASTFNGISVTGGLVHIQGNTIGDASTVNSISVYGSSTTHGINFMSRMPTILTPSIISGNLIANISASGSGTSVRVRGIHHVELSIVQILNNTIHNLSTLSSGTGLTGNNQAAVGINAWQQSYYGCIVSGNVVHSISAENTGAFSTIAVGIFTNNFDGAVTKNLIYDITNKSTATDPTNPPMAAGIYLRWSTTGEIINNMILLGNNENNNVQFNGIVHVANGASTPGLNLYFNSVKISGTATTGSLNSFGFLRGDNAGGTIPTVIVAKNNILNNVRSGGTGKQYAIGNQNVAAGGWNAGDVDFNLLHSSSASTIGLWGTSDQTLSEWRISTGGDANSVTGDPLFVSDNDLHITNISSPAFNAGTPIAGITTDFDGDLRNPSNPDIGADEYGPTGISVAVNLNTGWNMISNPVTTSADSVKQLYPTSINSYAFAYLPGSGYTQKYRMENGPGYWVKFPSDGTSNISGEPRTLDSINVVPGWNMVGSISYQIDTSTITSNPPGIKASQWFGYSGGYNPSRFIVPGKAYWIKVNAAGKFVFNYSGLEYSKNSSQASELDEFNTITITDKSGNSQTLYFGTDYETVNATLYELPPIPPSEAFDVRFESIDGGYMLQTHNSDLSKDIAIPISIQSISYPITVRWNVKSDKFNYELSYGDAIGKQTINGQGQLTIDNSDISRIVLMAKNSEHIPAEFALMQNYPNPFNPVTNIKYALPVPSNVKVVIYNVLGQNVKTLVNEEKPAGYHVIEWSGTNDANVFVGTGVYYLKITAINESGNTFNQFRKMVLIK